ncbi:lytic transglycosylase domain-containing protein [Thauera sinica]|uniref:Transglycosylase SLT domain-containing protein n=1 Tax=Thauera sinica TaxID=2665146 RepID=A0ABW1ASS3_9RHOO|nr:lytic transglycosylase domain-containing protein [Thauera sp. K11]ATE61398.1 transglycosylase [Thauera sp. K11]
MKNRLWATLAAGLLLSGGALGEAGDARILAARDAVRNGERATLERLAAEQDGHVLDAYVRYWLLTNRLARPESPPSAELAEFLVNEAGSQLAERLRADWLRRLAKDGDWAGFAQIYPDLQAPDAELRCHARTARLMAGDRAVLAEVAAQWGELVDSPPACEPALRAAVELGLVGEDDVWWRVRRQVEGRTPSAARPTLTWLPSGLPAIGEFDQAVRSPAQYLDRLPPNFAVARAGRELALAALARLARDDARGAHVRLLRIQDRLEGGERAYAYAVLGWQAALGLRPEASDWFRAAGNVPMSAQQRAWRVRSALRALDWPGVRGAIEAMTAAERELPEWTYWLGRALAAERKRTEAESLYARIAGEPSFYGILAAEELGRPFAPPPPGDAATAEHVRQVEGDPGLRRALALFRLDMRTEGVREWNWALRGRDDGFAAAAARLALKNEIYDRAINTAERSGSNANFDLRYLTPYRSIIEPQVHNQGLDMSWVYGLMRQESRFVVPARSSVGAQGLMQVMPATGKWVAGKIGLRGYHPGRLGDPETNVLLGTSYMRLILEDLDNHPVLASAGYNAGPGRARRWRDDKPLEGAIYAETIPFDETRDYVRKVMANTVIYAAMLEKRPQSLKARLGTIAPRTLDGAVLSNERDPQ